MAAILALTGCGGLGVNIGSGTSRGSPVVNKVGITVQSGVNIYNVSRNAFLLLVSTAYYQYGSNLYVSATQGATWNVTESTAFGCAGIVGYGCTTSSAFSGAILLFNPDCATPYHGQTTQNICVFGVNLGAAGVTTAGIQATVAGVSSSVITINVQ
ncbi:MAG: hypothetical protein JO194_06780 [Candidatus Eremiobacteraeota bacterium]|nr:hypothetical protein [Candidatus Eremiobacteraeota bacterium]